MHAFESTVFAHSQTVGLSIFHPTAINVIECLSEVYFNLMKA